jgi:hypothetical protein
MLAIPGFYEKPRTSARRSEVEDLASYFLAQKSQPKPFGLSGAPEPPVPERQKLGSRE